MMFWNRLGFNKRKLLFVLITTALVVIFIELSLIVLASASSSVDSLLSSGPIVPRTVPDTRLVYRPNPEYPEHDEKGFRNVAVPTEVSVVALGDSQTYGTGVKSEDAWPRQLESLSGTSVYSMAYSGYGPVHSLVLLDEAINLDPNIIIEAFYSGNDLYDSFNLVYNKDQLPTLKSVDTQVRAVVLEQEAMEPIAERVQQMYQMRRIEHGLALRRYLQRYSKIYGLLRRIRFELRSRVTRTDVKTWADVKAFAERNSAYTELFEDRQFRTLFTPQYRLSALNLADPRIFEGQRISLEAIKLISERAYANDTDFLVVLIPTKELVFSKLVTQSTSSYQALVTNETQFWTMTKDFLTKHKIEYLDALPALQEQLSAGIQPYQISADGHPNRSGHSAIAELVRAYIQNSILDKRTD